MTGILEQLKWESLKKRRTYNRLVLPYKGLKGKARIPPNPGQRCHHPTAATKCNEQPSQAAQQTPSVEKHAHPPRMVYCAIYPTLTQFTKSRV